jgi:8-oxo-dGTP pyrophosphatase MutT (NUDIX family)
VVLFVASQLFPLLPLPLVTFAVQSVPGISGIFYLIVFSAFVLLIAALIPGSPRETWGSMWPLVGYDNAIDAIYVRGPWLQRFEELDELDAQKRMTTAMSDWF